MALLGLGLGSFMNVVVLRLNAKKSLGGRSACPQCHNTLPWYTLIPVFSYIALGGKCAFCKHTIAIYYPLVELAMGVLFFVLTIWFIDQPIQLIVYASVVAL